MESENMNFFDDPSGEKKIHTLHIVKDGEEDDLSIDKIFNKEKYQYFIGVTYSVSPVFVNRYLKDFQCAEIVIGMNNDQVKGAMNALAKHLKDTILKQIQGEPIQFYEGLSMGSKFQLDRGGESVQKSVVL
ncbi:hypothetical protein [Peptoniphilus sp. HCN-40583]|uniref:hypothetical protein n=1 Tax=Peptoniphilus sp. HCN-40583 TaxID=3134662 RepID=UPI0030C062A5